jgi:hypothetical protein
MATHWCLWLVGIIVIGTILAGLQAYNTVKHDSASHLAMTAHRNWALLTAAEWYSLLFGRYGVHTNKNPLPSHLL